MRHLIAGGECGIAGEATAAIAAPVAETFRKSRRFIKPSPQQLIERETSECLRRNATEVRTAPGLCPLANSRRRLFRLPQSCRTVALLASRRNSHANICFIKIRYGTEAERTVRAQTSAD